MQHHYYARGYLTLCRHWICSWLQCLMICLCEAHFKTEELLAPFVCAIGCAGQLLVFASRSVPCLSGCCSHCPAAHRLWQAASAACVGDYQVLDMEVPALMSKPSWICSVLGSCDPILGCLRGVCPRNGCASLQPEPRAPGETSCWRWHFCIAYKTNSWPPGAIY